MKKQILFSVFIFIVFLSKAQTWCPAGAEWYYGFDTGVWGANGYYHITYTGDTTIMGHVCKKMNRTEVFHSNFGGGTTVYTSNLGNAYTYADANKVYIFQLGQFYTLYDFSASTGSTWVIPAMQSAGGCPVNGIVTVTSSGSTIINGQTLRYVIVSPFSGTSWFFGANGSSAASAKIIEKIGVVNYSPNGYLFPFTFDLCDGIADNYGEGQLSDFRCYSDSSGFAYSLASQCSLINFPQGINEISNESDFIVSPNPTEGMFTIKLNGIKNQEARIKIFTIFGEMVFQSAISNNQSTINISQLKNGIYFLQITDEEKNVFNKKIILE